MENSRTWERKAKLLGRTEFPGKSLLWFQSWHSTNTGLIWSLHGFKGQFISDLFISLSKYRQCWPAQFAKVLNLEEVFMYRDLQELCYSMNLEEVFMQRFPGAVLLHEPRREFYAQWSPGAVLLHAVEPQVQGESRTCFSREWYPIMQQRAVFTGMWLF